MENMVLRCYLNTTTASFKPTSKIINADLPHSVPGLCVQDMICNFMPMIDIPQKDKPFKFTFKIQKMMRETCNIKSCNKRCLFLHIESVYIEKWRHTIKNEYFCQIYSISLLQYTFLHNWPEVRQTPLEFDHVLFLVSTKLVQIIYILRKDILRLDKEECYLDSEDKQICTSNKYFESLAKFTKWYSSENIATNIVVRFGCNCALYVDREQDMIHKTAKTTRKCNVLKIHLVYCPIWYFMIVLVTFVILNAQISVAHPRECVDSLLTLVRVSRCPANKQEWINAAQIKKCYLFQQNCSSMDVFQYHCVLDGTGTHLVEVCAPLHTIVGHFCAEFNVDARVIQSRTDASCEYFENPCEFNYASNSSYKYQKCYNNVTSFTMQHTTGVITQQTISNISNTTSQTSINDFDQTKSERIYDIYLAIALGIVTPIFSFTFTILLIVLRRRKLKRKEFPYMWKKVHNQQDGEFHEVDSTV